MTLVYELMPLAVIALGVLFLTSKRSRTQPAAARRVRWALGIYVPPVIGAVTYMLVALQAVRRSRSHSSMESDVDLLWTFSALVYEAACFVGAVVVFAWIVSRLNALVRRPASRS
jgi:hypothetical protein